MENRRVHVWVRGRVQGVFFRAYTRDAAVREGVAGWVRNLRDGRVEAVFEGPADKVQRMVDWCWGGSPLSRVDAVDQQEEEYKGEFQGFDITYRGG
ncbi:MAG: acylphosphatase [Deltaproteobacteria bacterium]|nr:acylphosphatase [Deltaproteobacteria bacterium]